MRGPKPWPAARVISAAFLETLLTDPTYAVKSFPGRMVISGARVTEPVFILDAPLTNTLVLDSSRFDSGLDIEDATSAKGLVLRHDVFGDVVTIQRSSFQFLWLRWVAAPEINISSDNFADDRLIESVTIPGVFAITATKIGAGGLFVQSANGIDSRIGSMPIIGTTIDGSTSISDAHFAGEFEAGQATFSNGLDIDGSAFAALAFFHDADFVRSVGVSNSSFDNDLRFDTSKFESEFSLENDNLCLGKPDCELFLADANFDNKVSIAHSVINGDLNADGATTAGTFELTNDGNSQYPLNFTMIDANIGRDLRISSTTMAHLKLVNASITGTLQLPQPGEWQKTAPLT